MTYIPAGRYDTALGDEKCSLVLCQEAMAPHASSIFLCDCVRLESCSAGQGIVQHNNIMRLTKCVPDMSMIRPKLFKGWIQYWK